VTDLVCSELTVMGHPSSVPFVQSTMFGICLTVGGGLERVETYVINLIETVPVGVVAQVHRVSLAIYECRSAIVGAKVVRVLHEGTARGRGSRSE